jgi:hypothetical protein
MSITQLNLKIEQTETLIEQLLTQWVVCEGDVLRSSINRLKKELEELYGERKRCIERQRRIK